MRRRLSERVVGRSLLATSPHVLFTLLALAFLCAMPAATASGTTALTEEAVASHQELGFSVSAEPGATSVAPPGSFLSLNLQPGEAAKEGILVADTSSKAEVFDVEPVEGETAVNGGDAYSLPTVPCHGAACWLRGLGGTVTVPANASKSLVFEVVVPRGARPGDYLAGVQIAPNSPAVSSISLRRSGLSAEARVVEHVVIGVAIAVGNPALFTKRVVTGPVKVVSTSGRTAAEVFEANPGSAWVHPRGVLWFEQKGRLASFPLVSGTVLPGGHAVLGIPLASARLIPGLWHAIAKLCVAAGHVCDTWSGMVRVPAASPRAKVVENGAGPPASSMWARLAPWEWFLVGLSGASLATGIIVGLWVAVLHFTRSGSPTDATG